MIDSSVVLEKLKLLLPLAQQMEPAALRAGRTGNFRQARPAGIRAGYTGNLCGRRACRQLADTMLRS